MSAGIQNNNQTTNKFDDSFLLTPFSGPQLSGLELESWRQWTWGQISLKLALLPAANFNSGHSLFLLETSQMYLTMSFILKNYWNVTQNQYHFNALPTCKLKTIYQQHNRSCNTILILQCKIMQHNIGGTAQYWQGTQFQILVHFPRCTSRFFGEMVLWIPFNQTHEMNNCR